MSIFGIFYFGIVTPLSLYSDLNLNYMLSPPLMMDGLDYRLESCVAIGAGFFVARLAATIFEFVFRRVIIFMPSKPTKGMWKKKKEEKKKTQ